MANEFDEFKQCFCEMSETFRGRLLLLTLFIYDSAFIYYFVTELMA